ncbi:putative membrane protein [Bacillus cereus E33L]|nr:putative membrane protein [Bacillus cereus E33L]
MCCLSLFFWITGNTIVSLKCDVLGVFLIERKMSNKKNIFKLVLYGRGMYISGIGSPVAAIFADILDEKLKD